MFDRIAGRYDFLNRVMSFGIDKRWRKRTVQALQLQSGDRVLDLATGTGDLALAMLARHDVTVEGLDPARNMLAIGQAKAERRRSGDRYRVTAGVAEALPYASGRFDAACMAFGIRNCTDREASLREIARVVRPGGRVAILELSEPRSGLLSPLARFHVHVVIPRLGALLSGEKEYRYLQSSIAAFPPPPAFEEMLGKSGIDVIESIRLTMGTCYLYVGESRGAPS